MIEQSEIIRRLANLIRRGRIQEVDYDAYRARVAFSDNVTDWLPWITTRARGDVSWWAPEIGEQVVILSESGELSNGVILPALYQTANPPPASTPDKHKTTYADGTVVEYDRAAHKLTINIPTAGAGIDIDANGPVTLNCSGDLFMVGLGLGRLETSGVLIVKAPTIGLVGDVVHSGGSLVSNGITFATHVHSGVQPGGGNSAAPVPGS